MPAAYSSIVLGSTSLAGAQADVSSPIYGLSADGKKLLFVSDTTNLVAGDTNGLGDLFLKDLVTGVVTRVNTTAAGAQVTDGTLNPGNYTPLVNPQISADGTKVAFLTSSSTLGVADGGGFFDIYVKTLASGAIERISGAPGGGDANNNVFVSSRFSPDGTKVAFEAFASNVVAGDTNGDYDIFIRDLAGGTTTRLLDGAGAQIPSQTTLPVFSPDGAKLAFITTAGLDAGDGNGQRDVYLKDLTTGAVTWVSTDAGNGGNVDLIPVAFSPDGTKIAFISGTNNLVAGDTNNAIDVFVKTVSGPGAGTLVRANTTALGVQSASGSASGSGAVGFLADGRVVFVDQSALVADDANTSPDVYAKDLTTGAIVALSTTAAGVPGNNSSQSFVVSANGAVVAILSRSSDLVAGDANGGRDIFIVTPGAPVVAAAVAPASTPVDTPPPSKAPVVNTDFSNLLRYQTFGAVPALPAAVTTPSGQVLPNPLLEQQKLMAGIIAKVDAGTLSLQGALDQIVDLADGTSSVATLSYQFFTGRIPTKDGLDFLVSSPLNPNDLNDGYYAGMSLENRYINFAVNLGVNGEGRAGFTAGYGALTLTDATAKAYLEIFGKTADASKLAAILTPERSSYFASLGGDALGQKAAMIGFLLAEAAKSDLGPYAIANENFLYDLADGTAAFGVNLHIYDNAGPRYIGLIGEV